MYRWRILAVSGGYWHKFICVCTALNHSSTDLLPCQELVSKSNLALTSFDCGLQKSSKLVHKVSKVSSLSFKPYDTTRSIPSSPDHEISFLHCLLSDRDASSQSRMFSHFSFHFRNRWYNPSFTVQSILQCMAQMGGYQSLLFVPLVRWIGHFYVSFSLSSYCITSVGLWTTWSEVTRINIVYTYFNKVACDGCWRVCPSTGMLQNFSAMNLGVCTVV